MTVKNLIHIAKTTVAAMCLAAALCSCSITRRLPEGSYLLKRNVIEADKEAPAGERIYAGELGRHLRQTTNRHFLGTNLYAWIHAQSEPGNESSWNRFLRRAGEEPVVWSVDRTLLSADNLRAYVASRGFFSNTVDWRVDTVRAKKVKVRYSVKQGPPSYIGDVSYTFRDTLLRGAVLADSAATLLRKGAIFDTDVLDRERARITASLRNKGYYDFNVSHITYNATPADPNHDGDGDGGGDGDGDGDADADPGSGAAASTGKAGRTFDLEILIRRKLESYDEDGTPAYENHRVYRIGEIRVRPDYDPLDRTAWQGDTLATGGLEIISKGKSAVWPRLLRRAVRLRSGELYSASAVETTSAELMRLGVFRSVSVLFDPANDDEDNIGNGNDNMAGGGGDAHGGEGGSGAEDNGEGILNCDIRLVPGSRQSLGLDLEGSTTSSFYGLRATLGYQNRNAFGGAELFDASLTAGFEFLKASERKLSYELGGSVSLAFPRFVMWGLERNLAIKNPFSTLTLSANWQDRVYYSRALFGLSWEYSWSARRFENFTVRPADISLVEVGHIDPLFSQQLNNPYLVASYADQLIAGISASWVYNNQPRDLGAGAVVARLNLETTGNLFSGLTRAFSRPTGMGHYNIFGIRFSQYVRGEGSFSQKIVLGEKTALAYRLQGGAIFAYGNSVAPPFDKLFFAGGVNSMRGWAVRTLGPGTALYERQNYPAQMGDVKLEANLEFRFPVLGPVNGAAFVDVGNIWFMRSNPSEYPDEAVFKLRNFHRQLGFDGGIGARVDLRFVVLRLDWGIQLHSPGRPSGQRWIRDFRWRNTALSFGVGYPF